MNTKKALRGLCAIAVFATAPVQIAIADTDVFQKLHEACDAPSTLADAVQCDSPLGLACLIAKTNAHAASATCNVNVRNAEIAKNMLVGFVETGEGIGANCNSNLPPQCLAAAIVSLYNPTLNRSVSICAAAAPGAVSTTLVCDGFPGAPGAGGAAGAQPLGNALGCMSAAADFLVPQASLSVGPCAQPPLN